MHRFFVTPGSIESERVVITGMQARQIKEVLRLRRGDRIVVLDDLGTEYEVGLLDITSARAEGQVLKKVHCANEPTVEITVYQTLLKGRKLELVFQKCTEIGVRRFILMETERCVVKVPGEARMSRWRRIITEAAEQSRRGRVPELHPAIPFQMACDRVEGDSLLLWEGETREKCAIGSLLKRGLSHSVNVFIGPEGGFTLDEVEYARSCGISTVGLGKRILRAETAGLVAASVILYEFGELE